MENENSIEIYGSSNEDALVKSNGPFRLTNADMSIQGLKITKTTKVTKVKKIGVLKIYGKKILGEQTKVENEIIGSAQ